MPGQCGCEGACGVHGTETVHTEQLSEGKHHIRYDILYKLHLQKMLPTTISAIEISLCHKS